MADQAHPARHPTHHRRRVSAATGTDAVARFFAAARRHFDMAADAGAAPSTSVERSYSLAGRQFSVRSATAGVDALLHPSIQHLATVNRSQGTGPDRPALTIRAWGGAPGNVPLPLPPWEAIGFVERGNVRLAATARWMLAYDRRPGLFSALDRSCGEALYWAQDAANLAELERARPFRRVLSAWLHDAGLLTVHAAAVGTAAGAALICGRTGSGKSTTAIMCVGSELGYLGDDVVLVEPGAGGGPRLHSLYGSAKLNRDTLAWRPDLAGHVVNGDRLDGEKALVHVGASWPAAVLRAAPLRLLVVPRLAQQRTNTTTPISPTTAFRAMVPDSLFTTMGPAAEMIAAIGALVREVPAVELSLGRDVDGIPAAVGAAIAAAA